MSRMSNISREIERFEDQSVRANPIPLVWQELKDCLINPLLRQIESMEREIAMLRKAAREHEENIQREYEQTAHYQRKASEMEEQLEALMIQLGLAKPPIPTSLFPCKDSVAHG